MAKTLTEFENINPAWHTCYFIMSQAVYGAHHGQWVLDQVLRKLAGEDYPLLVEAYEQGGIAWDVGIAP